MELERLSVPCSEDDCGELPELRELWRGNVSEAIELEDAVAVGRECAFEEIDETEDAKEDAKDFVADVALVDDGGFDVWVDGTEDEIADLELDAVVDVVIDAAASDEKVDFVVKEIVDMVSIGVIDVWVDGAVDETVVSAVDAMVAFVGIVVYEVIDFVVDEVNDIAADEVAVLEVEGGIDSLVEETVDLAEDAVVSMVGGLDDTAEDDVAEFALDGILDRVLATVVVEGLFNFVVGVTVLPPDCFGAVEMSAEVELTLGAVVGTSSDVDRLGTDGEAMDSAGVGGNFGVEKVTGMMTAPVGVVSDRVRFGSSVGLLVTLDPDDDDEYRVSGTEVDLSDVLDGGKRGLL